MAKEVDTGRRFESTFTGKCFIGFVIAFEVLLVAATVIVGVWMGVYRGGFDWYGQPRYQFSYHPLFMFIGFVFLYGNGMLIYRMFRRAPKYPLKIIHAAIQASALVFAGVGLAAAFGSHNRSNPPITNMYSLHSWLGLITVILFGIQWLVGFFTFLLPFASENFRAFLKPIHAYFGAMLFVFVIAVSFAGMTEALLFYVREDYSNFPPEGVFANCLALIMGLIVFIGIWLVADFDFRRPDDKE